MLSLNRSSVYFVDGLSNASRGSSINYNIIDIAVDHILNGKRTALVAYTNSFKSGELHLRVALAVKLTCGAVLNAYFTLLSRVLRIASTEAASVQPSNFVSEPLTTSL